MLSIVHDMAEADVGDITPEHASGVSKETKLALESVQAKLFPSNSLKATELTQSVPHVRRKLWRGTRDFWDTLQSRV